MYIYMYVHSDYVYINDVLMRVITNTDLITITVKSMYS